jgi:SOS-response transcriptional repressor LexA
MITKKLNIFFPLLLFVIIAPLHQQAVAEEGTPQIVTEKNRNGRLQYAEGLLSFLKKIDNQIPSLSPSQKEWLGKEMAEYNKTKDTRRYIEITKTKEYNINAVKSNLAGMIYFLNKIIENLKIDKPSLENEKQEIYWWSVIVDSLMNSEFWNDMIILIEDFKAVDSKLFYPDHMKNNTDPSQRVCLFYINNGIWPARQIITNIIAPYLKQ